jgi:hypothetical protein
MAFYPKAEGLCCRQERSSDWQAAVRGRGRACIAAQDENGRKTLQSFSTFTFEYENESENGKVRYENEHELTEYREF